MPKRTLADSVGMDALLARLVRESKHDGWSIPMVHSVDMREENTSLNKFGDWRSGS